MWLPNAVPRTRGPCTYPGLCAAGVAEPGAEPTHPEGQKTAREKHPKSSLLRQNLSRKSVIRIRIRPRPSEAEPVSNISHQDQDPPPPF